MEWALHGHTQSFWIRAGQYEIKCISGLKTVHQINIKEMYTPSWYSKHTRRNKQSPKLFGYQNSLNKIVFHRINKSCSYGVIKMLWLVLSLLLCSCWCVLYGCEGVGRRFLGFIYKVYSLTSKERDETETWKAIGDATKKITPLKSPCVKQLRDTCNSN